MDPSITKAYVEKEFQENALPSLIDYVKIPNTSPSFDAEWETNGHLLNAAKHIASWIEHQNVPNLKLEIITEPGKTPLIYAEVPASKEDQRTVLMYGHFDKQPPFEGWLEGLGPTIPVIKDDKLYGRGGADDGYAGYGSIIALKALQKQGLDHSRIVIILEGSEESGSGDLVYYVAKLAPRIGSPDLIVCLDSGAGDYERLWMTTSLRGMLRCHLRVDILTEGVHSGDGSGIVPESFRIARQLLDRVEDVKTGTVVKDFHVDIPEDKYNHAKAASEVLQHQVHSKFPWIGGAGPLASTEDVLNLYLNRTWRPYLSIIGASGLPDSKTAGNVLRPFTNLTLSLRLPPTGDPEHAKEHIKKILEENPPYGAKVTVSDLFSAKGWNCPPFPDWLEKSMQTASHEFYGKKCESFGEGGSIPFMGMLQQQFPKAAFVVTGVLGPNSNAHGPNEFLHIPFTKKLISSVAHILADHFKHSH